MENLIFLVKIMNWVYISWNQKNLGVFFHHSDLAGYHLMFRAILKGYSKDTVMEQIHFDSWKPLLNLWVWLSSLHQKLLKWRKEIDAHCEFCPVPSQPPWWIPLPGKRPLQFVSLLRLMQLFSIQLKWKYYMDNYRALSSRRELIWERN